MRPFGPHYTHHLALPEHYFTTPPATPGSGNNKFRNNFEGEVGYEITPMQTLTVTALGRSGAALKAAARVNIWDVATEKVVASAV